MLLRDIPRALIGSILLAAVIINAANIVGRYFFHAPLAWAEEILSFLIIWGVCIGACAVTYERRHLVMDLFSADFPRPLRLVVDLAIVVVTVAVSAFVCFHAWTIVALMARNGQVSITAQVPMTVPYAAFVAGFGLIAIAALVEALHAHPPSVVAADRPTPPTVTEGAAAHHDGCCWVCPSS